MIFKQMLSNQKLILTRIETRQPPPAPVIARSTGRPDPDPLWQIIIIWILAQAGRVLGRLHNKSGQKFGGPEVGFCATLTARAGYTLNCTRDSWAPPIRANLAALTLLASVLISVILEALAAGYIQKMVGV